MQKNTAILMGKAVFRPTTKLPVNCAKIVTTTKSIKSLGPTMTSSNLRPTPQTELPGSTSKKTELGLQHIQPCTNCYLSRHFTLALHEFLNNLTKFILESPTPTLTNSFSQYHALLHLQFGGTAKASALFRSFAFGPHANPLTFCEELRF